MNDAPIVIEPRALTTLNNRPRSGSWSNYQYYKQQQQQQRRQQKQTLLQEAKHSKTNFFTKYIQKRPISTNATTYDEDPLDDESCLVELQQPPLTDVQLPMVSRLLSNGPDQLSKRKKDKRLGRFLKRLGKNAATFMNSDNDNHCPQTVTLPEHMQEQPMHGQDIPVTEPLPTNSPIHQHPIITTSVVTNTQSTIHHYKVNHLPKSTLDDIHLHYHHTMNDRMTFAPTMPRSTSFDTTRLRKQTTTPVHRLFAPNTKPLYHTLPTCTSPKDARILLAGIHDSSPNETLDSEQQEDVDGDSEEDYHSDSEDGSIDSEVDDSHTIDGGDDHLSKRLSGGHFGSAGGLIVNTLSLSELSTISNTKSLHPDDIDDDRPVEPVSPLVQSGQMEDEQEGDGSSTQYNMDSLVGIATSASLRHVNGDNDAQYEDDDSAQLSPQSSSVNELSTMEATAEDYARRIWEQDDTVYSSLEHVAEWIGNGSPSSRLILKTYMSYFDFDNVRLEDAFRQLCGKLSMKAESQQIDRILEEFSKKYWECNRQSIFGNADIIHAIVYSLVLLNTDLHVVKGERKKMSRPAFIRNTMDAIRSQLKQSQDNNIPILDQNNKSNISAVSLDDDKLASGISTHSQTLKHEWSDLKRTPSCRSAYSQSSSYSGKISSTFDGATTTLISSASFGSTKWQNELESFLKQLYTSVRHKQIMQPESKTINDHRLREATRNTSNGHRYRTFKRNVGTMMWKAARDSLFISDSKFMDVEFPQPSTPRSTLSGRSGSQRRRRRSISSIHSGVSQHSLNTRNNGTVNYQAVASLLHHSDLPTSYTSTAPYYKEGMIVRKHLMEQANQKARQRDWKECFMVVDRGEIRMYRLDGYGQRRKTQAVSSRHPLQGMVSRGASLATVSESIEHSSTSSDLALGGGDWLAHAQVIGEVDLKHTLSNALPSGYSRRRRHAFALQQANGGVYLFQVGSAEQVMEWVTTCNYWAARESKEPLMGGVGNLEYGWGACLDEIQLDDNDDNSQEVYLDPSITVSQWQPPVPPMMASNSNEMTQLETLRQHVKTLNNELDRHRDLKLKMEQKFAQDTPNRICAMTNFQNKTQYLLHEIIKYQNYCDSIETSLVLQDKAIHKENQETHS